MCLLSEYLIICVLWIKVDSFDLVYRKKERKNRTVKCKWTVLMKPFLYLKRQSYLQFTHQDADMYVMHMH